MATKEKQRRSNSIPLATLLLAAASWVHAEPVEFSAVGPLEVVDCAANKIRVLGVTFVAESASAQQLVCSAGSVADLRYVAVRGQVNAANVVHLVSLKAVSVGAYAPGSTLVYLKGSVSKVDPLVGEFSIGGAVVNSAFGLPNVGDLIEVVGIQPALGAKILSSSLNTLSRELVEVDAAIGSGIVTDASIGSGVFTNASIGSGVTTDASIGSGRTTNASIGSGVTTDASIGSGRTTNASIGSGVTTDASIGSGRTTNASIGSGVTTDASIGSGRSTNASIGSGIVTNASIGSGVTVNASIGSGIVD